MPGDFFKEKDEKVEKKKEELIDDVDEWVSTYNFENKKYQDTYDQGMDSVIPVRHELVGGRDPQDIGLMNELRKHLQLSKIANMTIGQRMYIIMDKAETLNQWSERYAEFLEKHVGVYQFLCKSAITIIDNLYKEMDEMSGKIEAKEQHITDLTTEPGEVIIPPDENRKRELEGIYENLRTSFEFAQLVNPKKQGKNFTPGERAYLKEYNKKVQKFKGMPRPDLRKIKPEQETQEIPNLPKTPPEPPVYSPLSQKSKPETPLKEGEEPS